MDVKRGDKGKYVPHKGHWNDWANREPCFDFVHHDEGHPKHGQTVEVQTLKNATPRMAPGHEDLILGANIDTPTYVKPSRPRFHWDAVVTAVHPDKTVTLVIQHPAGHTTLEYANVPVVEKSEDVPLHSFYVTEPASDPENQTMKPASPPV